VLGRTRPGPSGTRALLLAGAALASATTAGLLSSGPARAAVSAPALTAPLVTGTPPTLHWTTGDASASGFRVLRGDAACVSLAPVADALPGASRSYVDSSAPANAASCYQVVAYDAAGSSESEPVVVTYDTMPPPTPSATAASIDGAAPVVRWVELHDALADPVTYAVYRDHTLVADGLTTPAFSDSAAAEGIYAYTVTATDAAGNTSAPSAAAVASFDPNGPPTQPGVPSAASPTRHDPDLTWTASSDGVWPIASYTVRRDGAPVGIASATALAFADRTVATDGLYSYVVTAVDPAGSVSPPSATVSVLVDRTAPTTPGAPPAARPVGGDPALSWMPATDPVAGGVASGIAGYRVIRRMGSAATVLGTVASAQLVDRSPPDGVYTYAVAAVDRAGNVSAPTRGTTVVVDRAGSSPPRALTGPQWTTGAPELRWLPPLATPFVLDHYAVYRDGRRIATVPGSTTWYADGGVHTIGAHHYQVAAADAAGVEGYRSASVEVVLATQSQAAGGTGGRISRAARLRLRTRYSRGVVVVRWPASRSSRFSHYLLRAGMRVRPPGPRDGRLVYRGRGTRATVRLHRGARAWLALWTVERGGGMSGPAYATVRSPLR
jgi:fibronectin type 3 domain-containing protein